MSNQNQKQRSATERLNDVEQLLANLYQTADNMARDLLTIKEAIKLLANKLDSVAKESNLSDDAISQRMLDNNVAELKSKVDDLIAQGILEAESTVTDKSFVVGRESDDSGKIMNPRIQFTLAALEPETKDKLVGANVGQVVDIKEGKYKLEILESYAIVTPQAPQAEAPVAEATPAEATPATQEAASG